MEIFLSIGFLVSLLGSPHMTMAAKQPTVTVVESLATSTTQVSSTTLLYILAKKYGQDPELAKRIIACESQNVIDAHSPTDDFGYFQINQIHKSELLAMGLDREKWQDNLEFGFYLMKRDGTSPWISSKSCWDK